MIPLRIGRYEVLGLLGTGGMAEVFLGRLVGPSGFKRPVVIKRTLPHLAREKSFVDMFLDEARIVARIRHPNVVQVQELCQDADDLFLVMEYLEGESLAGLMRRLSIHRRLLGFDLCAHILAEAALGLHAAHELTDEAGNLLHLVHRDLSPANVFVTYEGKVKILDFGIATAADRQSSKTQAGQVKGKYPYMSPEQARGEALDRRSDLFSTGIVLFELSTCRRLFKRANEVQTVDAICHQDIPRPSKLVSGYPGSLEKVCMRALMREPDRRYPTALEMRRDLLAVTRELNPKGDVEETLREVMQRLFADRIEEKQAMLTKIASGRTVTRVPVAEADDSFELPDGALLDPPRVSPRLESLEPLRKHEHRRAGRRAWLLGALGAALMVVAGTALLTTSGSQPAGAGARVEPTAAPARKPEPEAAEPKLPDPEPAKDPPTRIAVSIVTDPAGAKIYVDETFKGTTPDELILPKSARPIQLRIERSGYRPTEEKLTPDRDQRLHLSLTPKPKPKPTPKKPPENSYRRFE